MTIKVLVDMNLSPEWVSTLTDEGWEAVHWSAVGDPRAPDAEIMAWALVHGHVVFTHDLDFGATLALTHSAGPQRIADPGAACSSGECRATHCDNASPVRRAVEEGSVGSCGRKPQSNPPPSYQVARAPH